ncbi:sensor domain-containing diguanylate cyclase [Marinobacter halodurans]|uniref:sensor domain-containing diguanylate cyclase n=1 Tax=Marinobacter halodurans TaxID=2528979 RepID=UPI0013F14E87|nr:diguanylate cyclase [Marinobacter halodurans]
MGISVGQSELESQARAQLATHADLIADDVDAKLAERFDAITRVAQNLTMEEESLLGRAQPILNRQAALTSLFHKLYLIDSSGVIRATFPASGTGRGMNVSDRAFFQLTNRQMTTLVSEPFISRDENIPIVAITAPVFNHDKRLIGILVGTINLDERSFLGDLKNLTIGDTGFVGMGTRSGFVLIHPRRPSRLDPLSDSNPLYDAARNGEEGVTLAPMSDGQQRLVAYRQLNEAPWFVTVSLPTQEAFEPIRKLSHVMFWVAGALLLLFIPLSLRLFSRLLSPLQQLADQIKARHMGVLDAPIDVGGGREIRELVSTFNQVRDEREAARVELEQQEAYFRSLSERSPIGIVQTDVLGRIGFVNHAFEAIVGQPLERLKGQHYLKGVYREDQTQMLQNRSRVLYDGEVFQGQYRLYDARTDRVIWVASMTAPIETPDRCLGTISVMRDITHELEVEAELRAARTLAERILGVLEEGVVLTDRQGFVSFANPPSQVFIGNHASPVGSNLFDIVRVAVDGEFWGFDEFRKQPQVTGLDAVLTNMRGDSLEVELTMLRLENEHGADQFVFVMRDDSERRRQEAQLSWDASHDPLTRLFNRRAFTASLGNQLMQAGDHSAPTVLMVIDLDHFKPVNDNGGHLLGDELLRHIADILRSRMRQSDVVARLGGDEFGVILPACGLDRAKSIAESLRAGIEALELEQDGRHYGVTASIGLTDVRGDDTTNKAVMARADEAAYTAKSRGRNRVVVYGEEAMASPQETVRT